MNDLHLLNPPFLRLISEIDRATEIGEIQIAVDFPVEMEGENMNENFRINLVTSNKIFDENMVWMALPFPESLTSLECCNNFFKKHFIERGRVKHWKIYMYE